MRVCRIISGGQTGVDRAALDVAIAHGVSHGGWCPRGRKAEDGRIPERYALRELASAGYAARTARNVVDSDGTLVLTVGVPTGGTALTIGLADQYGRPCLVVDLDAPCSPGAVADWLETHHVRILNVAGPRESTSPGIHDRAAAYLDELMRHAADGG